MKASLGQPRSLGADLRCSLPQSRSTGHLCECACAEEAVKTVSSAAALMMPSEALGGADGSEWDPALTPPGNYEKPGSRGGSLAAEFSVLRLKGWA